MIGNLIELGRRSNIQHFSYGEKDIFLYDDHRTLLNVLYEAQVSGLIERAPNLVYFDYHDDACLRYTDQQPLLEILGCDDVLNASSKDFGQW